MKARIIRPFHKEDVIDKSWIELGEADVYCSRSWMFNYFFYWPEKDIVACIDSDQIVIEVTEEQGNSRVWSDQEIPEIVMKHRNNLATRVGPLGGYSCAMISSAENEEKEVINHDEKPVSTEKQIKNEDQTGIVVSMLKLTVIVFVLTALYFLLG